MCGYCNRGISNAYKTWSEPKGSEVPLLEDIKLDLGEMTCGAILQPFTNIAMDFWVS